MRRRRYIPMSAPSKEQRKYLVGRSFENGLYATRPEKRVSRKLGRMHR